MTRSNDAEGDSERNLPVSAGDDMVCVVDAEQTCLSVNESFLDAFGMSEKDVVGRRADDPAGRETFAGLIEDGFAEVLAGRSTSNRCWWDFPCLGFRYVRIGLTPNRDDDGKVRSATLRIRDLSDAKLAQEALEASEQRFEDYAGIVSELLWELDENLRFVYLSARFEEIMGLPSERVLGRRRIEVFPGEDHATEATRRHHLDLARRRAFDDYALSHILDDGAKRTVCMSGRPIFDRRGCFRGYRGTARDVSELRRLRGCISHLESHDALTGLVNRQELLQRLQRVVDTASAGTSEHGLCYVDIDRFRAINDRWGHAAGDMLLEALAGELQGLIRRRDTLARVGGNAFAILMEHCSLAQMERVAESVQRGVGEFHLARADETIRFSVTIGVVPIGAEAGSVDRVLRAADRACYAAKSAGGDRILVYGRPDGRAARERRNAVLVSEDS